MTDMVNHPPHYNLHPSGIECIEITELMPSNLAASFKYVFRCGHKFEDIEDLSKSIWYLERILNSNTWIKQTYEDVSISIRTVLIRDVARICLHERNHLRAKALGLISLIYTAGYMPVHGLDERIKHAISAIKIFQKSLIKENENGVGESNKEKEEYKPGQVIEDDSYLG